MEALIATAVGILVASGVYLILRARTFPVILGISLFSYAANLFMFSMGRLTTGKPPILDYHAAKKMQLDLANYTDPLPQALVLTAIVISFGMAAFIVGLAIKGYVTLDTDHVDGQSEEGAT